MLHRFYNGGHKFETVLLFTNPNGSDIHALGRRHVTFEKDAFTEVDDDLQLGENDSAETVRGNFGKDLLRQFGHRGLVLVDPKHDPSKEDVEKELPARAPNDDQAMARGAQLWHEYTMEVVTHHLEDCESARAAGGAPRAARAFTKHCLKIHGITDPAERYMDSLKNGNGAPPAGMDAVIAGMQQQQASTNALVHALVLAIATGKKLDPQELEKLATTMAPTVPGATGVPGTPTASGVVTGKIKPGKSAQETKSGYETLADRPDVQDKQGIKLKGKDSSGRKSEGRKLMEAAEAAT